MGNKQFNIKNEQAINKKIYTGNSTENEKEKEANKPYFSQKIVEIKDEDVKHHKMQVVLTMGMIEAQDGNYVIQILLQNNNNEKPNHIMIFPVKIKRSDHIPQNSTGILSMEYFIYTFKETVILDYLFECNQKLIIFISQLKGVNNLKLSKRNVTKKVVFIGKLMGSKGQKLNIPIPEISGERSKLFINAEEVERNKTQVEMVLNASVKLGFSKMYFVIMKEINYLQSKQIKENKRQWQEFYQSEIGDLQKKLSNNYMTISMESLIVCNGDLKTPLKIIFYEFPNKKLVGFHEFVLDKILEKGLTYQFFLNKKKADEIEIDMNVRVFEKLSFIDYLKKGMQIALAISIDFTASNLDISNPKSNHIIKDDELNNYELAIKNCGQILAYYDYDQVYPVYGFGALVLGNKIVDHCFNVNLNKDPDIRGIFSVLKCYRRCLQNIKLYGPTHFAPMLRNIIKEVKRKMKSQVNYTEYNMLLILTDGDIKDLEETVEEIIIASKLPISIIIIGIGHGPFDKMEALDADVSPLVDKYGRKMDRDIVQFVSFEQHKNDDEVLIREVLSEIPFQIEEYYAKSNTLRKFVKPVEIIEEDANKSVIKSEMRSDMKSENYSDLKFRKNTVKSEVNSNSEINMNFNSRKISKINLEYN